MSRIVLYEEEQIKVENSSRFKKGCVPWNKGLKWNQQNIPEETRNKQRLYLKRNGKDGYHGKPKRKIFVFTKEWKLVSKYESLIQASKAMNVSFQGIGRACKNKNYTCKGFHIMYVEDYIKELSY